jgi:hypothetical protein
MPTTSNFGWTTPADTDLVKDGAAAIRTLGNGIDTSLLDLKGGTSGQVLSKNSNTDLDYTWVTPNVGDITEVQAGTGISVASGTGPIPVVTNTVATTYDAKGDLVVGTGADTFQKLTAGTNDFVLTAASGETTGLKWAAIPAAVPANANATVAGASVEGTSSGSFTDLATAGPAVTVTTGTKALIIISAQLRPTGSSAPTIGYAVSGATTVSAGDSEVFSKNWGNDEYIFASYAVIKTGLTAGSNTFTLKYKNEGSGTADFRYRKISVVDMGS